jgi:hypothetical protein
MKANLTGFDLQRRLPPFLALPSPLAAAVLLCEGGCSPFPHLHAGLTSGHDVDAVGPICSAWIVQPPNPMKAGAALIHWSWPSAPHHGETRLCISLPFSISFIANIARKRPELKRDKTSNCQTRDCSEYRKSIRAEKIDTGFEAILRSLKPSKQILDIAMSMLKDAWDQRGDQAKQAKAEIKRQHKELDKQQDALVERMVETSNPKVMAALANKITKLDDEKLLLTDKLSQNTKPKGTLGEIIELLRNYLANPWNIYESGTLEVRKTILKTAFATPLAYNRENGYRIPQVSVILDFLENHIKM